MLVSVLVALLLQGAPAPAAKASVGGSVVLANGEPVAGVSVTLARTDAALGMFTQMVAGDHPPTGMTMPAELLAVISEEIAAAAKGGNLPAQGNAEASALAALPIADIHSLIVGANGSVAMVSKSAPPTTTDSQGRFAFRNIEPGTYRLIFAGNGYARQEYGQRSVVGEGIPIVLATGQAKNDLVMRMNPVGAVAGHVFDKAGQPIAGVPVQLFRFAYDETGQRKAQRVASSRTDDRGEYRIYSLSAGRYYLSAGNPPGQANAAPPAPPELAMFGVTAYVSSNRIQQNYALSYFPGVADESAAAAMDVAPGADLGGINLSLNLQETHSVRGRVIDPRTGQPPPSANVSIDVVVSRDEPFVIGPNQFGGGGPIYNPTDGTFEFRNISPGPYRISVTLPNPNPQARPPNLASLSPAEQNAYFEAMQAADAVSPKAFAIVRMMDSDLEGVVLTIGSAVAMTGRLRVESAGAPAPSIDFLRVQLVAPDSAQTREGPPQSQPMKADGTFRINAVRPGNYRLAVIGMPSGYYLKEAKLGESDVLNGSMRFSGTDSGTLDLLVSSQVGQIDGIAADTRGQAMPGAQVVLIPDRNRDRTELFRPVTADGSGRFTIPAVTPGDYRIAAWEVIEPFAFFDSELIRQAEESAVRVHVAESSRQSVAVTTIP